MVLSSLVAVLLEVEVWLLEYKRQLGLPDKNTDDYQIGREIDNFFEDT